MRFSPKDKPHVHVYNAEANSSSPSVPWDEQADDRHISPTSIMAVPNFEASMSKALRLSDTKNLSTYAAACKPANTEGGEEQLRPSPPSGSQVWATPAGNPKSILRAPRFSSPEHPAANNTSNNSLLESFYGVPYPSLLIGRMFDSSSIMGRGSRIADTSVSMSPPRNGSGFKDHGVELSPIRRGGGGGTATAATTGSANNNKSADEERYTFNNTTVSFREFVERANCLYPDPPLLMEETSLFSERTPDIHSESVSLFLFSRLLFWLPILLHISLYSLCCFI